jgi:hypothetical protein
MALGLLHVLRRRGGAAWVPAALLALVTVDLGVANYWLIATGPQSLFETEPHALGVIREAEESADGERGPFRIFRPALFQPLAWSNVASDDRAAEGIAWERDSLAPKYGLPYRVDNAVVLGTMGLFDYEYFFAPWTEPVDPVLRRTNPRLPERVVRYAARSFDLWNVKYFVLPKLVDPADEYRGISSLLVEPDAPTKKRPILFEPPPGQEGVIDYQVVLNSDCFPRAWIVHRANAVRPIRGFEKADRDEVIAPLMLDETLDLRKEAVVETDRPEDLATVEPPAGGAAQRAEGFTPSARCEFVHHEPDRVTLSVRTPATGLLVLADTYYPGWEATLDGRPAEILRTNRMMRGLVVPAGEHTVTFTYRPALVYGSAAASAVGWAALVFATFLTALACFGSARMERFRQRRQERQKPYRVF